jgi:hypothetical protein
MSVLVGILVVGMSAVVCLEDQMGARGDVPNSS